MKVTPLDLRQQRFKTVMRGYDRGEVAAFLNEVADDYENALREADRLRQEVRRSSRPCSPSTAARSATCATRCSPRRRWPTRSRIRRRPKPSG